jgi:predicted RNA binding protein YcfA (HicA-like mRNA interferase family)
MRKGRMERTVFSNQSDVIKSLRDDGWKEHKADGADHKSEVDKK